ncbi:hypothetical protein [Proteiniclasticum ruminis]|uniref:hypothetical protein n=1 Tax=Proteiniclasticum ruminis TaxID=398199 RepID=UPI0028AA7FAC|nr:hypothetical protein [Proteiniclasticum ruminis]
MLLTLYALFAIASSVGMSFAWRQKNVAKKISYFALSSILLFLFVYLFQMELRVVDWTPFLPK